MSNKPELFRTYYFQSFYKEALEILKNCNEKEKKAIVSYTDNLDKTFLHMAIYERNSEMAKALIDAGSNTNHVNCNKKTCLMFASQNNDVQLIEYLLEHGAHIDWYYQKGNNIGSTALMFAADGGHLEAVECLLKHGAQVNIINDLKQCALHYAANSKTNSKEMINALLDKGADYTQEDILGNHFFEFLAKKNDTEFLSYFILEKRAYDKRLIDRVLKDFSSDKIQGSKKVEPSTWKHLHDIQIIFETRIKMEQELPEKQSTLNEKKLKL